MKNIYFNPLNPDCKNRIGGIEEKQEIQLNVFLVDDTVDTDDISLDLRLIAHTRPDVKAFLLFNKDGENENRYPMEITDFGWTITFLVNQVGLYFYAFEIEGKRFSCGRGQIGEFVLDGGKSFLLNVSCPNYKTPEWFKGGIIYQIFPDRFNKSGNPPQMEGRIFRSDWEGIPSYRPNENNKILNNDFFGGNLQGIIEKLSYLKNLHVSVLYLNPIFYAASNHRYDTSDYREIDPFLGTKEDFKNLIKAANQVGIKIILDGVFNHTGDNSVYFNKYGKFPDLGAYQSKESPYYSWYTFKKYPEKYASWWGIDILPEVNENSKEYQNFLFGEEGVLSYWLSFGIGGYRLDVADELPDFFLKNLRKCVKEKNKDAIIIGEVWEDASNKIAYSTRREYLQGEELDSVMNYPLKDAIIQYILTGNGIELRNTVRLLIDHYPKQTLDCLMNLLGTHDTSRILTVLGKKICLSKEEMANPENLLNVEEKQKAIEKLKMASVLLYTFFGVPCIYYGDENGAEGYGDPFCRKCFDWKHINEQLVAHYKRLGEIREEYRFIFQDGEYHEVWIKRGLYCFKRQKEEKNLYVYINNSAEKFLWQGKGEYIDVWNQQKIEGNFTISPYSYGIMSKI